MPRFFTIGYEYVTVILIIALSILIAIPVEIDRLSRMQSLHDFEAFVRLLRQDLLVGAADLAVGLDLRDIPSRVPTRRRWYAPGSA